MSEARARLLRVGRWLLILGTVAAMVFIARGLDWRAFARALRGAHLPWVLLAGGFFGVRMVFRGLIWRVCLQAEPRIGLLRLVHYTVAATAASVLTPARAGEALRLWLLRRNHGISLSRSVGVALGEKLLDALALLAVVLPLPWLLPALPAWVAGVVKGLLALAPLALALAWWAARSGGGEGRIAVFLRQTRILREPRVLVQGFVACLLAWWFDLATLWASMHAVGLHQGYGAAAFVLLAINAALLIPSTPGNLGTLEASAVFALGVLEVAPAQAAACAFVYHAVQLIPLLLFALLNLRLFLRRREIEPRSRGARLD